MVEEEGVLGMGNPFGKRRAQEGKGGAWPSTLTGRKGSKGGRGMVEEQCSGDPGWEEGGAEGAQLTGEGARGSVSVGGVGCKWDVRCMS